MLEVARRLAERASPVNARFVRGDAQARLTEQVLAAIAGQYRARQRPDGIWVRAAAWLVTARRPEG